MSRSVRIFTAVSKRRFIYGSSWMIGVTSQFENNNFELSVLLIEK